MSEYTPTTERVRSEYARDTNATKRNEIPRAEFDRWLEQVKAEAWHEGFVDGVNHDLGDWENAPSIINNPYRQGEK